MDPIQPTKPLDLALGTGASVAGGFAHPAASATLQLGSQALSPCRAIAGQEREAGGGGREVTVQHLSPSTAYL